MVTDTESAERPGRAGRGGAGAPNLPLDVWRAAHSSLGHLGHLGRAQGLHATIEDFKNDSGQMQGLPVAKAGGILVTKLSSIGL